MGKSIVEILVAELQAAGFRAAEGYPAEGMPLLREPAVAVSLQQVDTAAQTVTALVQVLGPGESGGRACERTAVAVLSVLRALGAGVTLEGSRYLSQNDTFSVSVLAVFPGMELASGYQPPAQAPEPDLEPISEPTFFVSLGDTTLGYPVSFRAWKETDELVTDLATAVWQFRLEELLPPGAIPETEPEIPFTIRVTRSNTAETYTGCVLTRRERIVSDAGLRRIRQGTAESRTEA